jgi:hypothetical protein
MGSLLGTLYVLVCTVLNSDGHGLYKEILHSAIVHLLSACYFHIVYYWSKWGKS